MTSADETGRHPMVPLRSPRHRVDRRAKAWWGLRIVCFWAPPLVAASVTAALWPAARVGLIAPIALIAAILVVKLALEPWWRYRVHRWEITDGVTYVTNGWIVQEWRVAPASRVQSVDVTRGPLEQLLGLASVRVTTASSYGAIVIGGLPVLVAEREAADLAAAVQVTEGDAT